MCAPREQHYAAHAGNRQNEVRSELHSALPALHYTDTVNGGIQTWSFFLSGCHYVFRISMVKTLDTIYIFELLKLFSGFFTMFSFV